MEILCLRHRLSARGDGSDPWGRVDPIHTDQRRKPGPSGLRSDVMFFQHPVGQFPLLSPTHVDCSTGKPALFLTHRKSPLHQLETVHQSEAKPTVVAKAGKKHQSLLGHPKALRGNGRDLAV